MRGAFGLMFLGAADDSEVVEFWSLDEGRVPDEFGAHAIMDTHFGPISLTLATFSIEDGETPGAMMFVCGDKEAEALDWSVLGWGKGAELTIQLRVSEGGAAVPITGFFVPSGRLCADDGRAHFAFRYVCANDRGRQTLRGLWDDCCDLMSTQMVPILKIAA